MEEVRHNCGLCITHTLQDAYNFLERLQHRGREAAGIAAIGEESIDVLKWAGPVKTFDVVDLHKILPGHNYHTFFGHVRYATQGRKDKILEDAHPHVVGGIEDNRGNHIVIKNCEAAIIHNGQVDIDLLKEIDLLKMKTGCDSEALLLFYLEKGEKELIRKIPLSYTLAIADKRRKDLVVMRDRIGIRPGMLGFKGGKYCVASEDIAIKGTLDGKFVEDLTPGSIYYLSNGGSYKKEKIINPFPEHCFFEWNYIAHVDSILNNESVRSLRVSLGEMLAEEFHLSDVDYVSYLPRCPETAARSYAAKTGKAFLEVFYKMRGERSFQGSTENERESSIRDNLHLIPEIEKIIEGKNLLIIDDSTIRGNNAKRAIRLLNEKTKINKVYLANYTPPIGVIGSDNIPRGCLFGVDMPPNDNFIIRKGSLEEISKNLGAQIFYLSVEGMLKAFENVGIRRKSLCTYCIGGEHPCNNSIL
ncbi:hypothetical protein HYW75_03670 [Candidatus Pacearchaeota archaeon]|nr:hypothetical protein [Candidatus Pacearchaeota archaeon]